MRTLLYCLSRTFFWVLASLVIAKTGAARWWPESAEGIPSPVASEVRPPEGFSGPVWRMLEDDRGRQIFSDHGMVRYYDGRQWSTVEVDPVDAYTALALDGERRRLWSLSYGEFGYFTNIDRPSGENFVSLAPALEAAAGGRAWDAMRLEVIDGRVVASVNREIWSYNGSVFTRLHVREEAWNHLNTADGAAYWYAGSDRAGMVSAEGVSSRKIEAVSLDGFREAQGGEGALVVNDNGVWHVPLDRREPILRHSSQAFVETAQRAYLVDAEPLDNSAIALGTFEEGLKVMALDGTVLWQATDRDSALGGERVFRTKAGKADDLFVSYADRLVRWQKPGSIWDWSTGSASGGEKFETPEGIWFHFTEGSFHWQPESGRLQAVTLLDGKYFDDLEAFADGRWYSFRDWVSWEPAGGPAHIQELADEILEIVPLNHSGEAVLALGDGAYHVVERSPAGLRAYEVSEARARVLDSTRRGKTVWNLLGNGTVERLSIGVRDGSWTVRRQASWQLPIGTQIDGELNFWDEIPFVYCPAGFFVFDPLGNEWRQVEALDPFEVTAHHLGRAGELTLAATPRGQTGGEQPLLFFLGARPDPSVQPEVWWIGADLPLQKVSVLHRDPARDLWWLAGNGRIYSLEDSVLRPLDAVPELEVISSFGATAENREHEPRLSFDTATLQFNWFFRNWSETPPFVAEIRLGGRTARWEALADPQIQYAGLREGNYAFETRIRDAAGRVYPGPALAFSVLPPWYRAPLAYFAYLVLAVAGVYGIFRFYSFRERVRREHLEHLVRQRTAELEAANAAKSEFVANMSHELRNPMNGVIGLSELLARTPLSGEQQNFVRTIRACAEQLGQMIGDVLDFAKIEAGRMRLEKRPFGLQAMVERAVEIVSWDATQTQHQIRLQVQGPLPVLVLSDDRKITQILVNLLSNACKYSEPGEIILRVRVETLMRNRVSARFEVDDPGPGLSEEERARVFERFYRSPRAANSPVRGSGLGLAVCAEIAELFGGTLRVERNHRGGSTFSLELGLVLPEGVDGHSPPPDFDQDYVGSVLVVDDMDYNRLVAAGLLESLGFSVTSVGSGKEALACLMTADYDFAFLDFDLPDLSGPEIVEEFRRERPGMRTRFYAVTAYVSEAKQQACKKAGMEGFVSKPISRPKVREALLASGLEESALVQGSHRPVEPDTAEEYDLEPLIMLARGDSERLLSKTNEYLRVLDEEVRVLRRLVEAEDADSKAVSKRLHRLVSHGSILKASSLLAAIEDTGKRVGQRPREAWPEALEPLEEAARELGVNLRRIVESYRSLG